MKKNHFTEQKEITRKAQEFAKELASYFNKESVDVSSMESYFNETKDKNLENHVEEFNYKFQDKIVNQDIIDFRHELIDRIYSDNYIFGEICNDGKTNVMTSEKKKVLEDVLQMFNIHFSKRGYDIG